MSGIGFLAGGAILRTGLTIQGLTTAAGLWLVTAIGMCAGAGMFIEAVVVTGMGITALTVLRRFEDKNDHLMRRRVTIALGAGHSVAPVLESLKSVGAIVTEMEYERRLDDAKKRIVVVLDVQIAVVTGVAKLVEAIEATAGVNRVHVSHHT